ncbi:MAG: WD40 repeat domain-containing protein [Leptolyngbya sp. SIO1D8]|nr:WD40 repeat domain-containing protein [Leptolyngbya sp. SIO1D8]
MAKPLGQAPIITISPDQQQVAVGDQDGRLLLWHIRDGRLQRAMFNFPAAIMAITFSEDGCTLAEGRQDGQVRLWDLQSEYGPELFTATLNSPLRTLAFSLDRQLLAGGDEAGSLHIWRLASGEKIHEIAAHRTAITQLAFSPCSRWLTTCGQDCAAVEWDIQTGEPIHRFQGRLTAALSTVSYLPTLTDRGILAVVVGRDEGQIIIWDISSARPLRIMAEACDMVMALALSPNGRYLAASDVSNILSVWEVSSRSRLYQISESQAPIESLVFSPDSTELMTGCDYAVQLWKVSSGQCLRSWRSDRHPAIELSLAVNPLQLLSSHDDQTLRCWRPVTATQPWLPCDRLSVPSDAPISTITTSSLGHYWIVGTEAGSLHIWDRDQQQWQMVSLHLPSRITALALSPNHHCLAVGDATGTVALWHLENNGVRWQKTNTHADTVMTLAFSPNSQWIFSGSRDRTVQGWDDQGNVITTLVEHRRRVHTLCVSGDGKTLYSGSYDGTVRCWDVTNGTCIHLWQQSDRLIHEITRDLQDRILAIVSDTQSLEIWDLETNTCRVNLPPQDETIWHVSVSPDGQSLVSASQDGEISIWSLESGQLQGKLRVDRPYEGMQIGGCTGLTDSERQMLYSLGATDY